jgi:TRAP-type transport system periplasmic protein
MPATSRRWSQRECSASNTRIAIYLLPLTESKEVKVAEIRAMRVTGFFMSAAVVVVSLLTSSAHTEPVTLRIASAFGPNHSSSKAVEIFKTELMRRTRGALDVAFLADPSLGNKDIIDGIRADTIFAIPAPISYLSRLVPEIEVLSLPFVFKDAEHAHRVVGGVIGKLIEAKLAAKGFIPLGWMALGSRNVTNAKRPMKTLADFKGLRIRVQPSGAYMAAFRALNAIPVAMDIQDVYTALKQGDIDAQENPYYVIYSNKFYDVQKYVSDTNHVFDLIIFIASKKTFAGLPLEQQRAVVEAASIATAQEWKMAAAIDADAFAALKASGMQFDPIPDATRAALKKAAASMIDDARQRIGVEVVNQVVSEGHK